ncbi:MAG: hypothetical protein QNK22_06905 [Xanthomonadales bacterium]|nr:hypothetical protein [Xanthomonadales bacterium]
MKISQVLLSFVFVSLLINPVLAKESREDKQARLDAACEVARQKKIAPMRQQVIQDCVANKEFPSRKECEQFYADYGERTGRKAALFYDLPECVTAFNFQQGDGN